MVFLGQGPFRTPRADIAETCTDLMVLGQDTLAFPVVAAVVAAITVEEEVEEAAIIKILLVVEWRGHVKMRPNMAVNGLVKVPMGVGLVLL